MQESEKTFIVGKFPTPPDRFGINISADSCWSDQRDGGFSEVSFLHLHKNVKIKINCPSWVIFDFGEIRARALEVVHPKTNLKIDWIKFEILSEEEVAKLLEDGRYEIVAVFAA